MKYSMKLRLAAVLVIVLGAWINLLADPTDSTDQSAVERDSLSRDETSRGMNEEIEKVFGRWTVDTVLGSSGTRVEDYMIEELKLAPIILEQSLVFADSAVCESPKFTLKSVKTWPYLYRTNGSSMKYGPKLEMLEDSMSVLHVNCDSEAKFLGSDNSRCYVRG